MPTLCFNISRTFGRFLTVKKLSWDINSYWQVVVLLAAAVAAIVVFEAVDAATVFDAAVVVVEAIAVAGVAELVENAMKSVLVEIALMTSSSDQIDCLV